MNFSEIDKMEGPRGWRVGLRAHGRVPGRETTARKVLLRAIAADATFHLARKFGRGWKRGAMSGCHIG